MPIPFSLPTRPVLPSLSWAIGTSDSNGDQGKTAAETGPKSAPAQIVQHSRTPSLSKRLSSSRSIASIRRTSVTTTSRPSTSGQPSPSVAAFGLPQYDDDDPFGVVALEKAGLLIKEAGTHHRPGSDAFQYRPSPNSPIWRSSMASAMSKASSGTSGYGRPSLDGRASVLTGRHSRQSSVSTQTGVLVDEPEGAVLDGGPLLMSPVNDKKFSRQMSPPDAFRGHGQRPPPLKLRRDGESARDATPSPRIKLAVVDENEDSQENGSEGKAMARKEIEDDESDLAKLARELREMADEHEERRRSDEEAHERRSVESAQKAKEGATTAAKVLVSGKENSQEKEDDRSEDEEEYDSGDENGPVKVDAIIAQLQEKVRMMQNMPQTPKPGSTFNIPQINTITASGTKDEVNNLAGTDVKQDEEHSENDEKEDDDDDDEEEEEEPVIIESAVQTAAPVNYRPRNLGAASLAARAQVVSIHLPPPPAIPSRNPRRRNDNSPGTVSPLIEDEPLPQDRPESLKQDSSPDNDSASSFSVEQERDSFGDVHDSMSQTSHGSDTADHLQSTPTETKMSPTFSATSAPVADSTSQSIDTAKASALQGTEDELQEAIATTNIAHGILEHTNDIASAIETTMAGETPKAEAPSFGDLLLAPDIPERKRPFSFEAEAGEEILNKPTIEMALEQQHDQHVPKAEAENRTPRAAEPIKIPQLPDDDKSEYEEDFS